jgi:hypothetical protein
MKTVLLALALAITGCKSGQFGATRIDPVLAALVPGDTIMLSGVRLAEARTTQTYAQLVAQQRLSVLDDFAKSTNFDPRKDVNEMLIASDGVDSVVLARGNFKLQAPAELNKSDYKGVTIYGGLTGSYAILDSTTAVVGSERGVRKAIDQKQSGRTGPAVLLDRAKALPGSGQIWFVSNGFGTLPDTAAGLGGNLGNIGRVLKSLESATAIIDLRSGLDADVRGLCRTDPDAKMLSEAIRGMVGLGRLSVPENQPEMLKLFDGIKVEQTQRSVQLSLKIPTDLIDRLLKVTNSRPGRG